ncbi:glycoprotein Xg [Phaethornis superciliosus]
MEKFRSIILLCLGFLLVHVRGQRDFDLADALDHPEDVITRKPAVIRRPTRPGLNNDLHLGDALGGGDIPRKPLYPPLPPRPGTYSNSGGFDDSDLLDGNALPPRIIGEEEHNFNRGGNTDSGLIAGVTSPIISAFVILVVGSIAAYSAYKNKKLCFKPQVFSSKDIDVFLNGFQDRASKESLHG